ncbi:uracil-DNA glycosylase [Paenibacillus amylolyticus]|uniref:uracil-DNA glycosylase n=1 Tax=Paenibacillus amylolyticus TaxID=1451 RepID=UPI003391062F
MSETQQQIREFVAGVQAYVSPVNVINPWRDYVTGYDIGPEAVKIRSEHLVRYLEPRMSKARYIFIAEAVGYQGARFSGVPLTSERMVTGNHSLVNHQMIFSGEPGVRTSLPNIAKPNRSQALYGFAEPTASIIWGEVLSSSRWKPTDFIFWNIYPFHPYQSAENRMTNRTPTLAELEDGLPFARQLMQLNPDAQILAIGRKSADTLSSHLIKFHHVPHPANGRAVQFQKAVRSII